MKIYFNFRLISYGLLIFLFLIASYTPLFTLSPEKVHILVREDGIIESCSAICYFFSACLLFYLFIKSKSIKGKYILRTNRNYFFLLLGLLFVLCLGEEISWGQRIFNINPPEWISKINRQNEINIHNINVFHGLDENDNPKKGLAQWINLGRWYSLFWFFYCVLIHILNIFSDKTQNILRRINLPIVPIWITPFFLFNYVLAKSIEKINFFDHLQPLTEIKENNYALLFLVVSISFYFIYKKKSQAFTT